MTKPTYDEMYNLLMKMYVAKNITFDADGMNRYFDTVDKWFNIEDFRNEQNFKTEDIINGSPI